MIVIPSEIKALIFDLDGTLADTMPLHFKSWVATGEALGVNITKELIIEYAGMPTVELIDLFNQRFGWTLDAPEVRSLKTKYYNSFKEEQGKIQPVEKIFAIARDMRGTLPMSVGTGSSRPNALKSLEDLVALDWWETIITGSDAVQGKPSPEIFLSCAEAMQVAPESCLVFEDGKAGIQAAKAANMHVIDINKELAIAQ